MRVLCVVLLVLGMNMTGAVAGAPTLTEFKAMTDEQKVTFLDHEADLLQEDADLKPYLQDSKLQAMIQTVGEDLAGIWPDTILEGPYATNGDSRTQLTGVFRLDGKTYGYTGIVSAPGLMIDDPECILDEENDEWTNCPEVTLYQNFYMDFSGQLIESENYPEAD